MISNPLCVTELSVTKLIKAPLPLMNTGFGIVPPQTVAITAESFEVPLKIYKQWHMLIKLGSGALFYAVNLLGKLDSPSCTITILNTAKPVPSEHCWEDLSFVSSFGGKSQSMCICPEGTGLTVLIWNLTSICIYMFTFSNTKCVFLRHYKLS